MDVVLVPLIHVIIMVLNIYWWAVVIYVILGWLEQANVINRYNNFIYSVHTFLFRIVEPGLLPIRRLLPNFGGVDVSPMVLILGIWFVTDVLFRVIRRFPF